MQLMARAYGVGGEDGDDAVSEPSPGAAAEGLTLGDVLDLRAYERVREDYRAKIIAAQA